MPTCASPRGSGRRRRRGRPGSLPTRAGTARHEGGPRCRPAGVDAERRERIEDLLPALGRDEDIEVDVDRRPRLRVVGESERAADRVWDLRHPQRFVDRDDLLGKRVAGSGDRRSESNRAAEIRGLADPAAVGEGIGEAAADRTSGLAPLAAVWTAIHSATARSASLAGFGRPSRSRLRAGRASRCRRVGSRRRPCPARRSAPGRRDRSVPARPSPRPAWRRCAAPPASGGLAAFARAFSMTSSLSSLKVARVRLRGPFGVLRDSRISNSPRLVGTTKAIVGKLYHYECEWPSGPAQTSPSETAWLATTRPSGSHCRFTSPRRSQTSGGRIASTSQGASVKLK